LIAPPWIPVPPPGYGGTEAVVDNLARGLSARGHDVVLFTVAESTSPVEVRSLYDTAVEPMGAGAPEAAHVLAAYDALTDVDVIHDHTLLGPLVAARHGPDMLHGVRAFVT
jgi:glycosyltransferase involved in cell wall biosynthesis